MQKLLNNIRTDWLFYFLVLGYLYLVASMTVQLWFGDGVNIFASYSTPTTPAEILLDANKVYWSKTSFLFLTLLLLAFNSTIALRPAWVPPFGLFHSYSCLG